MLKADVTGLANLRLIWRNVYYPVTAWLILVLLMATFLCRADAAEVVDADVDLLDFHGTPTSNNDRSFNIFFDSGAWHGYSLPPVKATGSGFVGPFVHSLGKGQWVGNRVAQLQLHDTDADNDLVLTATSGNAAPGYLRREYSTGDLRLVQTLFYPDSWHAVIRNEISATRVRHIRFISGAHLLHSSNMKLLAVDDHFVQQFSGTRTALNTKLIAPGYRSMSFASAPADYSLTFDRPLEIDPQHPAVVYVEQTLVFDTHAEPPVDVNYKSAWDDNRQRWASYFARISSAHLDGLSEQDAHHIAAKAVVTLIGNWRAARGDLMHDGVIPSYSDVNYNGYWAWDSWKHVAALASVAPDLARSQLWAMFDYQTANGMIPDCIFMNKSDDNFRDSKPPLAGWAAWRLYKATGDRDLLAKIYDKLVRYHRWWVAERDHDHNGLAEYGSTDGTLTAAAWESGMDNAVRFDDVNMIKNGSDAWSADQESVDLNAYLFEEKRTLADIAGVLGKESDRLQWLDEAEKLKALLQSTMFDSNKGYFFDRKLNGGYVSVYGPEGWIPLWAGAASKEQARRVAGVLSDPKKFATKMPFPSLAADDPRFSPVTGYWRGAVWIDQAYFAIVGLHRYGFDLEASAMAYRLVGNAQGLTGQTPFHEVYDPLTGTGLHAPNFSWSAAHFLMLLND